MEKIFIIPTNTCFGIACPVDNVDNYKKIYKIKARDIKKPLAILCDSFEYLEKNTSLNNFQINFLKNYKNPFTILIEKEKISDKNLLKNIEKLPNSEIYKKIAFRVAHNFMQKKLIRLNGSLFLTSANKSNNPEIFSSIKVKEEFKNEIEKFKIKVFAHNDFCINSHKAFSDIFEFIGNTTNINFLRK